MRFMKNYGRVANHAPAYSMNDEFSRVLHQQMEFFSSNPSADTLNRVRGEVGEASNFKKVFVPPYFVFLMYPTILFIQHKVRNENRTLHKLIKFHDMIVEFILVYLICNSIFCW